MSARSPESQRDTTALDSTALAGLLDVLAEPAILLNREYKILGANHAYCAHYGTVTEPAILGQHCYAVSHHYAVPCDQAGESCPLKTSLESGEPQRVLHLHHTPRGEEHVDVETYPIRDDRGEIRYFVEILRSTELASATGDTRKLVGRAPAFNHMLELVQRVAPTDTTVLLLGETGTGKEVVAHAIHDASTRHGGAFVPVECSGLSETLFESELFGHEKGAFTGAHSRKPGLVEAARGGTLFLDEVGDIPLAMQVKLLRLLETASFRRVGSVEAQAADFRLVCATHRDLKEMVAEGSFREDLYYRISPFPVHLPALQERREDIPLLVDVLLTRINPERQVTVGDDALNCLARHAFPGNIRELRNILERALIMADGNTLSAMHLPPECRCDGAGDGKSNVQSNTIPTLEQVEAQYLRKAVAEFAGDKRELAKQLGISERTLYRKLNQLD